MNKTVAEIVEFLEKRLLLELPGQRAHMEMTPYRNMYLGEVPNDAKKSAVLLNIIESENAPSVLLIKRPTYNGVHSAQVSFPGGRQEESDTSNQYTALRENEEEIGIPKEHARIIGALSSIYIPPSKSLVFPFVATGNKYHLLKPDKKEVDYTFNFPLKKLLEKECEIVGDIKLNNGMVLKDIPYYQFNNEKIWGATCAILNELKIILKEI